MQVAVARGEVSLRASSAAVRDTLVLRARHLGLLSSGGLQTLRHADLDRLLAWTEGRLVFHDAALDEVARQLERRYDLHVELAVSPAAVDVFNAEFDDDVPLGEILNGIAVALNLRYTRDRGDVTFHAAPLRFP